MQAQSIYTWSGADGGSWTVATNWTPSRTSPATNDILQFSGNTSKTITNVTTQTIGQLLISGTSTIITFQSAGAVMLTIGGGTGTDLSVSSGCQFNLSAGSASNIITINLLASVTGVIAGSMTFSGAAHKLTAADASGIIFQSGAVFTTAAGFTGNAFGGGTTNSVLFSGGSQYNSGAGSDPFSTTSGVCQFQTGSLYKHTQSDNIPSFSGRTYANVEFDLAGATWTVTGTSAIVMNNLTITHGILNFNMSANPGHSIKGNISVASGQTLNFNPSASGTINLNGTSSQTISGTGTITFAPLSTFVINNQAGVILNRDLNEGGNLTLSTGTFTIGSNTLSLSNPIGGTTSNLSAGINSSITIAGFVSGINIPSTVTQLNNLTLNNINGTTLQGPLKVNGVLNLTSGLITTTSSKLLTLGAASNVSGGNSSSFINGPVGVTAINGTMMAPVGKGSAYRPLFSTLSITSGSGVFIMEQIEQKPTGSILPNNVKVISALRYFHLAISGDVKGNANITLTWGVDDGVINPSRMTVVAGTNGSLWYVENNSGGYTGNSSAGTISTDAQSTTSFSNIDLTLGSYDNNTLPVNLISFSAVPFKGAIKLVWKTSVETGNYGFDIERSIDKFIWTSLAFIPGQGTSNISKEYYYSDNSLYKSAKYYYRLKQIDNNGGYKYSNLIESEFKLSVDFSLQQNYPNPFNPATIINYDIPFDARVTIEVFNITGQKVAELVNQEQSAGYYSVDFGGSNLSSGVYIYRIVVSDKTTGNNFTSTKKMMLLK
jgi:hypothetical protein